MDCPCRAGKSDKVSIRIFYKYIVEIASEFQNSSSINSNIYNRAMSSVIKPYAIDFPSYSLALFQNELTLYFKLKLLF